MATDVFMREDFFEFPKIASLRDYPNWAQNTQILIQLHIQAEFEGNEAVIPSSVTSEELASKLSHTTAKQLEDAIETFITIGLAKRRDDGALVLTETEVLFKERDVAEVF